MAPGTGLEPATSKLTASCSTIELPGNIKDYLYYSIFFQNVVKLKKVFIFMVADLPVATAQKGVGYGK